MNLPGCASGNWSWRMSKQALTDMLKDEIYQLNFLYSRLPEKEITKNTLRLQSESNDVVKPH